MTEKLRVYVDTNILLYWLLPTRASLAKPSTDFIKDINNGKYEGIISYLTINEIIKGIRSILIKQGKFEIPYWKRQIEIAIITLFKLSEDSFKFVYGFSDEINQMNDNLNFGSISEESFNIIQKYPGKVENGKHDGLSTADSMHIVLAKKFNCDKIASFDKDFSEASSEIESIVLKEEYVY